MLGLATNDAKLRAQKIAEQAGTEIGDLKSASYGSFSNHCSLFKQKFLIMECMILQQL